MQIYGIPRFASSDEFLRSVASKRGKLKKGGVIDIQAAARLVLGDWNGGRIPFYTLPPSRGNEEHSKAEVVNAFGSEFNVDAVRGTAPGNEKAKHCAKHTALTDYMLRFWM